jgi:hypothetical protein
MRHATHWPDEPQRGVVASRILHWLSSAAPAQARHIIEAQIGVAVGHCEDDVQPPPDASPSPMSVDAKSGGTKPSGAGAHFLAMVSQ